MGKRSRVLVAPLDWGLGHATRCIPVIRALLTMGQEPVLAGTGSPIDLLRGEFPGLRSVPLLSYNIRYARHELLLALGFPRMVARVFSCARREHDQLESVVRALGIDIVISDQRFGCYSRAVPSFYISHQLCVKMPRAFSVVEKLVGRGLRFAADRFQQTWIPDMPGSDNLTGDLTGKYPLPHHYRFIGPLSRFASVKSSPPTSRGPDLLVMLSGPEPQRTLFERTVLAQVASFQGTAVIVRGRPGCFEVERLSDRITLRAHADSPTLLSLMQNARAIVCRGGYTTIMELVSLGRTAVLVPTPGQTEQLYLCRRLSGQRRFIMQHQASFNLEAALSGLSHLGDLPDRPVSGNGLLDALTAALDGIGQAP